MKHAHSRILLCIIATSVLYSYAVRDHFSHSFMFTRPGYYRLAAQQAGWHLLTYYNEYETRANIQAYGFGQDSRFNEDVASYFLFPCSNTVTVRGDNYAEKEMRAEWIGLPADFSGSFSLNPEQRQFGFALEYHQAFSKFIDHPFLKNMWFGIYLPFVHVRNTTGLTQIISTAGTPSPTTPQTSIIGALDQADWNFGKIRTCASSDSGIAELRLKIGRTFLAHDHCEVNMYSLVVFPTHDGQDPAYLFNAFAGNNDHFAFGTGANFQFPLTEKDSRWPIQFFMSIEHQYRIGNNQCRTFDLVDKPLSRFLQFTREDADPDAPPIQGVNLLTLPVKINPDSVVDMSAGFRLLKEWVELEAAYNLWARCTEDICPCFAWPKIYGIRGSDSSKTASHSTISDLADDDEIFTPLTFCDIDLDSGTASGTITHTVHVGISVILELNACSFLGNIGAFYEIPQNNTALNLFGGWAKIAVAF